MSSSLALPRSSIFASSLGAGLSLAFLSATFAAGLAFSSDFAAGLASSLAFTAGFASVSFFAAELFVAGFSELRGLEARDFITEILIKECGAIGVVCGFNFAFGKNRAGTPTLLRDYFKDRVITLDPIYFGDQPVSSSRIRAAIKEGDVSLAQKMLGRPYSISQNVISGRQDGRKLGFPTLNQEPQDIRAIPAFGVYVTRTTLKNGSMFNSVSDIGLAPTLDSSGKVRIETHILDKVIDTTPFAIKVEFLKRIRGEFTFNSINELKTQIALDTEYARNYFSSNN